MAFNAPHTPLHVPPAGLTTVTGLTGTSADISANPDKYLKAALEALDTEVGRLFTYLNANNLMDSTNIIFIGDNGNDTRTSQNPIKSKSKNTLYDYGVRVPMIISGPSVISPNRASSALVNTTDLLATICEMNGFSNWLNFIPASKKPVDCRSLVPIIKNTATKVRDWNFTQKFTVPIDTNDGTTIRNQDYHLMRLDDGTEEFYNQSLDPFENTNLINTMSLQDIANYNELCDSLHSLIGSQSCLNTGIKNMQSDNILTIYPNPTDNLIHIESKNLILKFEITDCLGNVQITTNNSDINLSQLLNGVYFIKAYYHDGYYTAKIIKKE